MTRALMLLGAASVLAVCCDNGVAVAGPAVGGGPPRRPALHSGVGAVRGGACRVTIGVFVGSLERDPTDRAGEQLALVLAGRNDVYGDAFTRRCLMRQGQR